MDNKSVIVLVATECPEGEEAKFNKWYNEGHVPMVMECPDVKGALRFKRIGAVKDAPLYLALYEFKDRASWEAYEKSPQIEAGKEDVQNTWEARGKDPLKWIGQYEVIKSWEK